MLVTEFDANINSTNVNNATPLHRAIKGNNINIITFLLNKGANYNIKDINGKRPEDIAINDIKTLLITKRLEDESYTLLLKEKHIKEDIIWNENNILIRCNNAVSRLYLIYKKDHVYCSC